MDTLFDVVAIIVLISVPTLLGLIYLELRQRRMFGSRTIISADSTSQDTAAIAMTLQAELERLRADVHGALTTVSTDIERVRDHMFSREPAGVAPGAAAIAQEAIHFDPDRAAAISELYAALSKLDVAFLAVTRPAHLPGEPFDVEGELPADAFRWESWSDVGAAAYAFAESFSERRVRLDSATREQINATIGSIRRGLTAHLFPVLTESGGYIAAETRATITRVVGAIAADISDARAVLEHTSTPAG